MTNESRNEINPETLVFNSIHSRMLGSADFYLLDKYVANYHHHSVRNQKRGTIFEVDYIFLLISMAMHWIPAVIFNPSIDPSKFQGKAG